MELLDQMEADGMIRRAVRIARREIVYLKSIIEAYPGLASVHAPPGRELGETTRVFVMFPPGAASEVDAMLGELALEITMAVEAA